MTRPSLVIIAEVTDSLADAQEEFADPQSKMQPELRKPEENFDYDPRLNMVKVGVNTVKAIAHFIVCFINTICVLGGIHH